MKFIGTNGGNRRKAKEKLKKNVKEKKDIQIWSPTLKTLPEDQDKISEFGSHP
jgi:hypothetical protein